MDFRRLIAMLFVTTPSAVVLSVCIGVGGCLWTIYLSEWRDGMASRKLMKRAPSSASAAEDMTALIIFVMVITAPLLGGMAEFLDMKKCPPSLLRAFVSEIYEASLWPARNILLALYVMIASGWEAK